MVKTNIFYTIFSMTLCNSFFFFSLVLIYFFHKECSSSFLRLPVAWKGVVSLLFSYTYISFYFILFYFIFIFIFFWGWMSWRIAFYWVSPPSPPSRFGSLTFNRKRKDIGYNCSCSLSLSLSLSLSHTTTLLNPACVLVLLVSPPSLPLTQRKHHHHSRLVSPLSFPYTTLAPLYNSYKPATFPPRVPYFACLRDVWVCMKGRASCYLNIQLFPSSSIPL